MAVIKTLIGNIKGPKGDTGATGATGAAGAAATIEVGSVTTTAAGTPARVENVGTESAAILNFSIPQGPQGSVGDISALEVNAITIQAGGFPVPAIGDTVATVVGKQAKATLDAQAGIGNLNSTVAKIFGDFASVETTATASKAYAVGDYLVKDGQFYKVTAAIAQGNALTVGGNIEATNVGAEVSALNNDLANALPQLRYKANQATYGAGLEDIAQHIDGIRQAPVYNRNGAFIFVGGMFFKLSVLTSQDARFACTQYSSGTNTLVDVFFVKPGECSFNRKTITANSVQNSDLTNNPLNREMQLWY